MRLALKIATSIALLTVVILALSAIVDYRRRHELLAMDLDGEARLAVALRAVLEKVCDLAGPDAARQTLATLNVSTPQREIRWLAPREVPHIPGRDLGAELVAARAHGGAVWVHWPSEQGEPVRYMYIPIAQGQTPIAVIEVSESMAPVHRYVRRQGMQTAAIGVLVLVLSAGLAAVLGRWMVGQPLDAISRSLRSFAEGEYVAPPIGRRRDELGQLATELSALGARLAERERLRHDDRLRTVGQLASGVAHELGTPLSVVAVRARLIASGESTGTEAQENARAVLEQTERMTRLVRQLLDYSRRSAGEHTTVDLHQAVLQTIEMLEPLARSAGVTIVAESDDGGLRVRADAAQLQQVLTNIVLNGAQAMTGGGRLEIRCGRGRVPSRDGTGASLDRCWIRIRDEGPGVAPDDLPHLFEPFYTSKPVGEGTGLGLAVAQAIVEEHGGWIGVESRPGHGATFTVYLPPAPDAAERLAS